MTNTLILIPARMASGRLPGKPLAKINCKPMICQVIDRAREANIGEPIVATDTTEIMKVVENYGAKAVMTSKSHESGSDRIWEAVEIIDPNGKSDTIINLQGDLPAIDPMLIHQCTLPLEDNAVDIATIAAKITDETERTNPNVIKAIGTPLSQTRLRALYFTRATAPYGEGPLYHHIGLYAYKRKALQKFVSLKPSTLEKREKLEQLRALENDMRIDIELVRTIPHGVDTAQDLEKARQLLER